MKKICVKQSFLISILVAQTACLAHCSRTRDVPAGAYAEPAVADNSLLALQSDRDSAASGYTLVREPLRALRLARISAACWSAAAAADGGGFCASYGRYAEVLTAGFQPCGWWLHRRSWVEWFSAAARSTKGRDDAFADSSEAFATGAARGASGCDGKDERCAACSAIRRGAGCSRGGSSDRK